MPEQKDKHTASKDELKKDKQAKEEKKKAKQTAKTAKDVEKGSLSIHTENIFPIIKKWLYSQHDIFLRELISNAVDAINKRKYADPDFKEEDMKISVKLDSKKKTIEVSDTGIGMTADEIRKYINQIAFSGAEEFVNKFKDVQSNIIGHFGLGFYSSFMVAEKVTIDSLSCSPGSEAAGWECDGSTEYVMRAGKRKEIGTTITVHLNEDSHSFAEDGKIRGILEKYCNFMPWPIMFKDEQVNQKEALWNRKPKDVTEEEYKEFYRKVFHDWQDPVFWIHLNADFPVNLRGILYFPKLREDPDFFKGEVKLYCNNVFVADNLEDLIPDFLLLLKGGIDIPDIPLNVSRSFLQNDAQVRQISKYIVKKVADRFGETFAEDRKKYEEYWKDIDTFIKFGLIRDEDFFEAMKDRVIFKSASGDYVTLEEYKARNKSEGDKTRIWYASGEDTQVSYLSLMKEQGIEVIYQTSPLDTHLYQQLESKLDKIEFIRVDSEINDLLVDQDKKELVDRDGRAGSDKLKEIFYRALGQKVEASFSKDSYAEFLKKHPNATTALNPYLKQEEDRTLIRPYEIPFDVREELGEETLKALFEHAYTPIKVEVKSLKSPEIPSMIVFNEFMRRWHDMSQIQRHSDSGMLKDHTLVVNRANPVINKILELDASGKKEEVNTLCTYLHDLSLLEQRAFSGDELKSFISRANQILNYL
ncbi:MAG TPA: molecular chaperone HtpG [Candidatus Syntrophosphaera sp.]|jgi:molecular chaperone HtpG|nr:molecular chaperone HtpG [Candidatus Cloacimonadota bacterium]HOR02564.1 molecular chaperone HtpG [Candidatus Syntrophosphaera sp.]HPB43284.1 molecular chaperone HtpG [Candidatus Syntrophosphaera sp.]HPK82541.1 molecular chaperone HtpG [Candidatus Syntrophosphaera sp.]HPX66830.1 molecular chaperone HtpG [Candidatus Syntrophosphaera sp.]